MSKFSGFQDEILSSDICSGLSIAFKAVSFHVRLRQIDSATLGNRTSVVTQSYPCVSFSPFTGNHVANFSWLWRKLYKKIEDNRVERKTWWAEKLISCDKYQSQCHKSSAIASSIHTIKVSQFHLNCLYNLANVSLFAHTDNSRTWHAPFYTTDGPKRAKSYCRICKLECQSYWHRAAVVDDGQQWWLIVGYPQ